MFLPTSITIYIGIHPFGYIHLVLFSAGNSIFLPELKKYLEEVGNACLPTENKNNAQGHRQTCGYS
jgi:hypothetical protein